MVRWARWRLGTRSGWMARAGPTSGGPRQETSWLPPTTRRGGACEATGETTWVLNVHVDELHNYRVGGGPHCVPAISARVITLGMSTSRTMCPGVTISWTLGGDKHSSACRHSGSCTIAPPNFLRRIRFDDLEVNGTSTQFHSHARTRAVKESGRVEVIENQVVHSPLRKVKSDTCSSTLQSAPECPMQVSSGWMDCTRGDSSPSKVSSPRTPPFRGSSMLMRM